MARNKIEDPRDFSLVAAIDFGTTFSGYAFSTKQAYTSNPLDISAKTWTSSYYQSTKTSTAILFDSGKKFDSFGFEAEDKYFKLTENKQHVEWYFFRRFKMILYENMNIGRDAQLKDENGKEMLALKVFSSAISYLKEDLLSMCKRQNAFINHDMIRWVITVPALWNDKAKLFMRDAAQQAGISGDQLLVALEPEAASLYCIEWIKRETPLVLGKGEKIVVLDAGGGTVDVAVHEIRANGRIQELHKANGGDWGGTKVDEEFRKILTDIVGHEVFKEFEHQHRSDYIDFFRDFEVAKRRDFSTHSQDKVSIRLPSIVNELCIKFHKKSFNDIICTRNEYINNILLNRDKLQIDLEMFKKLFTKTIEEIIKHLSSILENENVRGVTTIFTVGGYSECYLLYDAICKKFSSMSVKVPREPVLSVIKGAVIYGHRPEIFESRISPWTYGIETTEPFVRGKHPDSKRLPERINGHYHCDKIFCIHVREGDIVTLGKSVSKKYKTIDPNQSGMDFKIFATKKRSPKFTDEAGCFCIGKLKVDLSKIPCNNQIREIQVDLVYGGTELEAVAKDTKSGTLFRGNFVLRSKTRKVAIQND